ncbi:MAG: hypothetical protein E7281_05150 [Lachnospiraceae bacterium]|nr:hypothetical protein [Lachnospiraceae bacterium]
MTFFGLVFLVFNFGKAILVKMFAQIGPTCGYYSFVQALYEAGYINVRERWPVVYDILSEDFANNNSMVGEKDETE